MTVRRAVVVLSLLLAGPALGEPIIAKDEAGRSYRLNDNGTYDIFVKSEDGRTFLLGSDGAWFDLDEDATMKRRLLAELDKAMAGPNPPKVDAAALPKYRECTVAAFMALPRPARRMLLGGGDLRENFRKFERAFPDASKQMNASDRACRDEMKTAN